MSLLPWYALKVRTNGESKVKTALELKGYPIFLPTWLDVRKYSDRLKKVHAPLFPGYLFCRLDPNQRLPLLTTPGVDSIVGTAGTPSPLEESEIADIHRIIAAESTVIPWPYLKAGDRVKVEFGSLAGLEGILIHAKGKDRLILSLHLLQRSTSVEIDRTWVRPLKC